MPLWKYISKSNIFYCINCVCVCEDEVEMDVSKPVQFSHPKTSQAPLTNQLTVFYPTFESLYSLSDRVYCCYHSYMPGLQVERGERSHTRLRHFDYSILTSRSSAAKSRKTRKRYINRFQI
jgi:hypothetical protein